MFTRRIFLSMMILAAVAAMPATADPPVFSLKLIGATRNITTFEYVNPPAGATYTVVADGGGGPVFFGPRGFSLQGPFAPGEYHCTATASTGQVATITFRVP